MSKGSKYRPVNRTAFEIGYGRVFGVKCSLCGGRCYSWDVGVYSLVQLRRSLVQNVTKTGN